MKSKNWVNPNEGGLTGIEYFNQLIAEFPVLEDLINDWEQDLIHMRMEEFADYTIDQIKNSNNKELKRCFVFQEERIELMDSGLENALQVSYCESLLLGDIADQMEKIIPLMGPKLQAEYKAYEKWYNKLSERHNQSKK